jgi:CxxC motif-containing protein (DUF1111 family)
MRMLAPPTPAPDTPSIVNGRAIFARVGCGHCHVPTFTTGKMIASGSSTSPSAALSNQPVNLFSDLLVHHMGRVLRMASRKVVRAPMSSEQLRCGVLGNACSSSMTGGQAIWCKLSKPTEVQVARRPE